MRPAATCSVCPILNFDPCAAGIFTGHARRWRGRGGTSPLLICEAARPIFDPKTAFDSPDRAWISRIHCEINVKVIDDVTGQVEAEFFIF